MEGFSDIMISFGADLEKVHPEAFCHFLALFETHLAVVAVGLVADEDLDDIFGCVGLDLPHPVLEGVKRSPVVDGVDHYDAHSPFVIGLGDRFEPLLTGGIPNLQSDLFALDLNGLYLEINADGGEVRCHEIILAESQQDICLAYSAISNY